MPGHRLNPDQQENMQKAFNFFASRTEGARQRKREGQPPVIFAADVPKLLRGCGRLVTKKDERDILMEVPKDGLQFKPFCALFERNAKTPQPPQGKFNEALRALDVTQNGTLDPKYLKEVLLKHASHMVMEEDFDVVMAGLPRDRLGRISCGIMAQRLVRGPHGMQYLP